MPENHETNSNNKSLLIKLLAIIILGGILVIIFTQSDRFKKPQQPNQQTTTTPSSQQPSDRQTYKSQGVIISYPNSWVVRGQRCGDAGGIECTNLAPRAAVDEYTKKYGNNFFSISGMVVTNRDSSVREFMNYMAGFGPFAEDKDVTINGYPAVYVKSVVPDAYTDYYYAIEGKDKLVYFYFRSYSEAHPEGQPAQIEDYSQYLPDYQSIVNSIKFD